jgi:putative capsular polysaccharide biosynthesis glycosyl transferase
MVRKKICFVVAVPGSAESFLKDHIKSLSNDYDVYLVANLQNSPNFSIEGLKDVHHVGIHREISIAKDCKAVIDLAKYFRKMKFDAVHSVTPKAGLVTAMAARLAGVKNRTHIFTGQVWATRTGAMKNLLKSIDKLIVLADNHILVDGESQRQFLIAEGVVSEKKSKVLGAGSICGANTERFTPSEDGRVQQREIMNIPNDKVVFAFMGRLNRDKGIYELIAAFNELTLSCPKAYLLIFGRDEENCLGKIAEYPNVQDGKNYQYFGPTSTPQLSLLAADVFCLPSYREGFGMSVIEASCLGLPVICSDAYGLGDTMVDNETGLRCKVADVPTLVDAMKYLYNNPAERKRMGENGRKRVLDLFSGEKIVGAWYDFYKTILG